MSRSFIENLTRKIEYLPRLLRLKVALALMLIITSTVFFLSNLDAIKENKKMLKVIRNEKMLERSYQSIRQSENMFRALIIPLKARALQQKKQAAASKDQKTEMTAAELLEEIKSRRMTRLLRTVRDSSLKVDSYRSEIENKDGNVYFKYNLTLVGTFMQALRFFLYIAGDTQSTYVTTYKIQLHQEVMVRMGIQLECIGVDI